MRKRKGMASGIGGIGIDIVSDTISNSKEKMRLKIELFTLTCNNTKLYKYIYTLFNNSRNRA